MGRAPREKRHTSSAGSTSASAGTAFAQVSIVTALPKVSVSTQHTHTKLLWLLLTRVVNAELDSPEGSLIREGEEYQCPFCYSQSFDVAGLIDHVNQEHAYQQRSAVRASCMLSSWRLLLTDSAALTWQALAWPAFADNNLPCYANHLSLLQRCPVCNKPVRDVLQHLSVHHQDAEECSSPSSQASSSMSQSMSMVGSQLLQSVSGCTV